MKTNLVITFILFHFCAQTVTAQKVKIHADFLHCTSTGLGQEISFLTDGDTITSISVAIYQSRPETKDSVLVCQWSSINKDYKTGLTTIAIDYYSRDKFTSITPDFYAITKSFQLIPPGEYKTVVNIHGKTEEYSNSFLFFVDSNLSRHSTIQEHIFKSLATIARRHTLETSLANISADTKVEQRIKHENGLLKARFYYRNWFLGTYTLNEKQLLKTQLEAQSKLAKTQAKKLSPNNIDQTESLVSNFKTLTESEKQDRELTGSLMLSSNFSNIQDPYSHLDRNYYELNANVQLPVCGIPIELDGYYTTQDLNRIVKASYIRFHYDAQKSKDKLKELIGSFNHQYEQSTSQTAVMSSFYKSTLKNLSNQQNELETDLKAKLFSLNKSMDMSVDTGAIYQMMLSRLLEDSSVAGNKEILNRKRDSITKECEKYKEKYREVKAVEQKVEKYTKLYEQFKTTNLFDSLKTYDKLHDLRDCENMSYKDLAKKAKELLPNGKYKQTLSGLTAFDVGMLNQYTSKYTMAGQQLKGLHAGYDMGFANTAISLGKTQYLGRDGSLDTYNCYDLSIESKPILKQKIILDYYGYTPSQKMIRKNQEFFKDLDMSYPNFQNPGHVLSLSQEGQVGRMVHLTNSIASSIKKSEMETNNYSQAQKIAYSIGAEADIFKTNVMLSFNYDHIGIGFENKTLPVAMTGTDRYQIKAKGMFFKNFLQAGIDYNRLLQLHSLSRSRQIRWGFDVKTKSKQYPNVELMYKPFSTVRTLSDTFLIPQRPILGSVWMLKGTYQYNHHHDWWRFSCTWNRSNSAQDTLSYANSTLQCMASYSSKKLSIVLNLGSMNTQSSDAQYLLEGYRNHSYQIGASLSLPVRERMQWSTSVSLSFNSMVVFNTGAQTSMTYSHKNLPISYRMSTMYSRFKLSEVNTWQNRIGGTFSIIYNFKTNLYD